MNTTILIERSTEESLFDGADLSGIDVEASIDRFECLLEEVLGDIYPEAKVQFSSIVKGYHVFSEGEDPIVVESIQEQVQRIAEELFEEGNWYIDRGSDEPYEDGTWFIARGEG